ncbi:MAG: cytochrome oxidase assembly protein, partial [Jatrophihabitantaceae bacterium]|nr:cytochrome oxidase assembly protein [Jatrophihabitantaceae bacterium]
MGVSRPGAGSVRRLMADALRRPVVLRLLALASVVANVGIVVTGGAVRLTASGLGCPTWPRCTDDSLVPTAETAEHGVIEFGNRMLTFVVTAVAIATLVVALMQRRGTGRPGQIRARLSLAIFLGIPAQAVLGGLTVLTGLNPWLVGAHFLLSIVLIALAMLLVEAIRAEPRPSIAPGAGADAAAAARLWVGRLTVVAASIVLVIGTIVTGSGPHAG